MTKDWGFTILVPLLNRRSGKMLHAKRPGTSREQKCRPLIAVGLKIYFSRRISDRITEQVQLE
jgi:hypothetical protein